MSDLAFVNKYARNSEHTINTMIAFKDFEEYYKYKDRPMSEIAELMNSRLRELTELLLLDKNIREVLESRSIQQTIEKEITKAIEEGLKK